MAINNQLVFISLLGSKVEILFKNAPFEIEGDSKNWSDICIILAIDEQFGFMLLSFGEDYCQEWFKISEIQRIRIMDVDEEYG